MQMAKRLCVLILMAGFGLSAWAASVFTTRPDDPHAVYLAAPEFAVKGDGVADDSAAIQAAIDQAQKNREGIVFIPSGRYRLTRTIYIWPSVRVIGYGATRPVLVLGPNTPGFQTDEGVMVMFTGFRPGTAGFFGGRTPRVAFPPPGSVPPDNNISDAGPSTFYSAISNIDFEIGAGNPAAIAIRSHFAQHSYLSHLDIHVGSGLAALTEIGNEAEDLHIDGGRYGIVTDHTSPAWQFTLIDSSFTGQREAAIREHMAGLTLVHDSFANTPVAIAIDSGYSDEVWVKDSRFENISTAGIIISNEQNPQTEIGFEDAVLHNVPTFAQLRESGKKIAGRGATYRVADFNYGVIVPGEGRTGTIGMIYHATPLSAMPAPRPDAIPALPPTSAWVNVHTLGVIGDGTTDDTAAIQNAIDSHRVLYFPSGDYRVTHTLMLKPDTVLIGLHPTQTVFDLLDSTPGYQGVGAPNPVVETPRGGSNIMTGIGIITGDINPRAVGLLWRSGASSLVDDVHFAVGNQGGRINRPPAGPSGPGAGRGNAAFIPRANPAAHWDGKYPSLWVTDGGGGTFADNWTPDTFAQAGFYVSYTSTPGHVYQLSNEHHVRNEIKLDHVQNWDFDAPQTEEESATSPESVSLEIDDSSNITIANYHGYRVTRSIAPFPAAVRLYNDHDIHFRNVHVNAESGYGICDANGCGTFLRASKYPFANSIQDMTHHLEVREREFAVLDIPAVPAVPAADSAAAVLAPGTKVKKLEDGFYSISGATVDAHGKLYFVDRHQQRIFGLSAQQGLTVERDNALDAVNLAVDKSGDLIVMSSDGPAGTVYAFKPGSPETDLTLLKPQPTTPRPNAKAVLPVNYWNNGEFRNWLNFKTWTYTTWAQMFVQDVGTAKAEEYVSPDGSVFLPAGRVFQQGPPDVTGWRFSDNLDTYGFVEGQPGQRVYVSSESEDITYSGVVGADGTLSDLRPLAARGGESVAVDGHGNVYVANGQIFVYAPSGKQIGEIDVPARPIELVFGGAEGRRLYILTHHTLYSAQVR